MTKKWTSFFLALTVLTGISCNQCDDVTCSGSGLVIPVFVSNQAGTDLFDGETGIYDYTECTLYRITSTDTIFYSVDYSSSSINPNDSVVLLNIDARYFDYFFQFSDGDVDSLSFRYTTSSSQCCGAIYDHTSLIWNGQSKFPSNDPIRKYSIRK